MKTKKLYFLFIYFLMFATQVMGTEIIDGEVDEQLLQTVNEMLPERENINPLVLERSNIETITFTEDTSLWGKFIFEGAGYQNSFGYYQKDESGNIQSTTLIENASMEGAGGTLTSGDYFKIGDFSADDEIGFYIWGNGYNRNPDGLEASESTDRQIYYSETQYNQDGIDHLVSATDLQSGQVILGFEDLYGGGDKDYNDLVFTLFSEKTTSLVEAVEGEVSFDGSQSIRTATGMVTMEVAMFARLQMTDEIWLTNQEQNFGTDVIFSGSAPVHVESNCGVIVSSSITPLSNGIDQLIANVKIDNSPYPLYTAASSVHNRYHIMEISTVIDNYVEIEAGDYLGTVQVTLSVY